QLPNYPITRLLDLPDSILDDPILFARFLHEELCVCNRRVNADVFGCSHTSARPESAASTKASVRGPDQRASGQAFAALHGGDGCCPTRRSLVVCVSARRQFSDH